MATTSVPSLVKFAFKDFKCFTVDQKLKWHNFKGQIQFDLEYPKSFQP